MNATSMCLMPLRNFVSKLTIGEKEFAGVQTMTHEGQRCEEWEWWLLVIISTPAKLLIPEIPVLLYSEATLGIVSCIVSRLIWKRVE